MYLLRSERVFSFTVGKLLGSQFGDKYFQKMSGSLTTIAAGKSQIQSGREIGRKRVEDEGDDVLETDLVERSRRIWLGCSGTLFFSVNGGETYKFLKANGRRGAN